MPQTAASNIAIQLNQHLTNTVSRKIKHFMKVGFIAALVLARCTCAEPWSHKAMVHMSFITLPGHQMNRLQQGVHHCAGDFRDAIGYQPNNLLTPPAKYVYMENSLH